MRLKVILIFLLSLFTFIACSKDKNPTAPKIEKFLKLNFINGRIKGQGCAILHSLDGTSALSYANFTGDATVDFGQLDEGRATFTYIDAYQRGGLNYIDITSDINAVAGMWTLEGYNYSYKGIANVTVNYPPGNYDWATLGLCRRGISMSLRQNSEESTFNYYTEIYYLNPDGTFTLFGSVTKNSGEPNYCGWLINQPFQIGNENIYTLNLTNGMSSMIVNPNRVIQFGWLDALTEQDLINIPQSHFRFLNDSSSLAFTLNYSTDFPAEKYNMFVGYEDDAYEFSYSYINKTIPSAINIPNASIDAVYNPDLDRFENIVSSGQADQIRATWRSYDYDAKLGVTWYVYAAHDATTIEKPYLPAEIFTQIPDLDLSQLKAEEIELLDYDTASSFDDVIKIFFKSNKNRYNVYKESYSYSKYIQTNSGLTKEMSQDQQFQFQHNF